MRGYKRMIVCFCVALLTLTTLTQSGVTAEAAKSTQEQIKEAENEKKELKGQLDETNKDLKGLKGQKKNLQSQLAELNAQMTEVLDHLSDLENQIEVKEGEIADTQAELADAMAQEELQYAYMVSHARSMYMMHDASALNALLRTGSFSEMLNAADCFDKIADYGLNKFTECMEWRKRTEEVEATLQAEKVELDNLKVAAEADRAKLEGLIGQTNGAINQYSDQISDAEKKAKEYEAEIKKKEEDLAYLKKKLEEEIRLSAKAAQSVWRSIGDVTFEEGDRKLLANLIYCEAGGEPYEGQLAVGSVVINRVLSSVYPSTVSGVIYQKSQFSPAASGRLELALASDRATARCYQAADEAMAGVTNVGNCVYFRTPVEGLTGIRIGNHIFY